MPESARGRVITVATVQCGCVTWWCACGVIQSSCCHACSRQSACVLLFHPNSLMHALSALWTALEMQSACMHLGTKGLLKSYPDVRTNNSSLLRETKNKSKWRAMHHCWRMKTPRTQQPTDLIRVGQNINEDGLKPLCYLGPNKKGKKCVRDRQWRHRGPRPSYTAYFINLHI